MRGIRRHGEHGFTLSEAMVALSLIGIGLTCSFSLLLPARDADRRTVQAVARASAAERIMEQTLSLRFDDVSSRRLDLAPDEVGGHRGWTAEVHVTARSATLKEVAVVVRGGGRTTEVRTLITPWRTAS